ncbi:cytochrome c [uncultured Nevskia sp.]|uniref:c-type cytochrome n=1 Tax=uncultured Nevskia sp. TaxID=228950 RepID=UPI0025E2F855|nr:cytochrome c [uncultured Nevskia sp.]
MIKLSQSRHVLLRRAALGACVLVLGASAFSLSAADPAPAVAAPTAKQVIDVRRALFTLIGSNFRPVGDTLQGKIPYDAADIQKRVARVAFLAPQLSEVFPDFSATGETKAKPEIWSNRADFDTRLKDFQTHVLALAQVVEKDAGNADAFKAAAAAVGKDCKGCHDEYKAK